jgi:biopolymer transport protein ExbD
MLIHSRLALAAPRRARVEIIPLIDVIFFLLATFVLFTLSMSSLRSLLVTLPHPSAESVSDNVNLQITDGGAAYWNQELISLAELPARLETYKKQAADPRIFISGDDKAKFGPVVMAIDKVRQAGITNYSVETRPRSTGK